MLSTSMHPFYFTVSSLAFFFFVLFMFHFLFLLLCVCLVFVFLLLFSFLSRRPRTGLATTAHLFEENLNAALNLLLIIEYPPDSSGENCQNNYYSTVGGNMVVGCKDQKNSSCH